jgi:hypothetical protein
VACTLVDPGQFLTNPDVTQLERSCDSATHSYELLLIHPDNKYGNCDCNSNYSEKCKVKKVRRDQLNHKRLPARYRNTVVREL